MAVSLDTHGFLPDMAMSHSQLGGMRRGSSNRLYKSPQQRRKNSSIAGSFGSLTSSPTSATTAFPSFDPTYEYSQTYVNMNPPPADGLLLFSRRSEDHPAGSAFGKKIKPLVRHASSRDKDRAPINLNMSKAENEERGAYVSDMPRTSTTSARSFFGSHVRTTSGTSQLSSSSTNSIHNHHRPTSYIHPARQIPHSPTPPVPSTGPFNAPDLDRPSSSQSNLASIPSLPPPGHYRSAVGGGILRSNTSTPTQMTSTVMLPTASTTVLSTSVPATSRSSIDSSFRDRITAGLGGSRHRSRTNSNAPLDPEEEARTVAALRADFNAREAAKDEKYRRREEKRDRRRSEAEERKARRRRGNSGATAGSNGSGIAASTWSAASETTNVTVPGTAGSSPRKAGGRTVRSDTDNEPRPSVDHLEGISYSNTAQSRRPTMDVAQEGEEEEAEGQAIPKRGKKQGIASASKATQSLWMTFRFKVQTAMMKKAMGKKK